MKDAVSNLARMPVHNRRQLKRILKKARTANLQLVGFESDPGSLRAEIYAAPPGRALFVNKDADSNVKIDVFEIIGSIASCKKGANSNSMNS